MKRSPMPRSHTRIVPRSVRRIEEDEERRACVAAVVARDGQCMFFPLLSEYMQITRPDLIKYAGLPRCDTKPLTAHEPAHSRNVGRLDPDSSLAMCWRHNSWVEDCSGLWREHVYGAGLLVHGNGLPLHHHIDRL